MTDFSPIVCFGCISPVFFSSAMLLMILVSLRLESAGYWGTKRRFHYALAYEGFYHEQLDVFGYLSSMLVVVLKVFRGLFSLSYPEIRSSMPSQERCASTETTMSKKVTHISHFFRTD